MLSIELKQGKYKCSKKVMEKNVDVVFSVSILSEEGFFEIFISCFGHFEHFGTQYLTEYPDKADSPLTKSGINSIAYYVNFWRMEKVPIIRKPQLS